MTHAKGPTCLSYSFSSLEVRCVAALSSFLKKTTTTTKGTKHLQTQFLISWHSWFFLLVKPHETSGTTPVKHVTDWVPVRRKSSAWPDRAACSSWRWLRCPPQTLPAESASAHKTQHGNEEMKSVWNIWQIHKTSAGYDLNWSGVLLPKTKTTPVYVNCTVCL